MPRRAGVRTRPGLLFLVLVAMLMALTGAAQGQSTQCLRVNPAENKTEIQEHREVVHRERTARTVLVRRTRSRWFRWSLRLAVARPGSAAGRIRPFSSMRRRDSCDERTRRRHAPSVLQVFRL